MVDSMEIHIIATERGYKMAAHELMISLLDQKRFDSLMTSHDYPVVCKHAVSVVRKTNLIFPNAKMSLEDGLNSDSGKRLFSESLYSLLYGEGELENRFNAFSDCLMQINASKWTTLTYFLFMSIPNSPYVS